MTKLRTQRSMNLITFLSASINGSIIFFAGELVLDYGALGGIAFTVSILVAFLLFFAYYFFRREAIALPLPTPDKLGFIVILLFYCEMMMMQALLFTLILRSLFSFSIITVMSFFALLQIILFVLQSRMSGSLLKISGVLKLSLLFLMAILLPNYIYLQKGLETVYHNLLHYHPQVLHLEQVDLFYFLFASSIILSVKVIVHFQLSKLDVKREFRKVSLLFFLWSTIILSFSTMTVIAITERIKANHQNEQLLLLIKGNSSSFIFMTIIILLLFVVVTSMITSHDALKKQITQLKWTKNAKILPVTFTTITLLSLLFIYYFERYRISILDLYLFFGILFVPFGMSLVYSRFSKTSQIVRFLAPSFCVFISLYILQTKSFSGLILAETGMMIVFFAGLFLLQKIWIRY